MMETMIPPQAGMRLRTRKKIKNERKREKGQCYYPFTTLVLHDRESPMISLSYTSGNFYYRTWLVYSNDGLTQNALGIREQASWMQGQGQINSWVFT